MLKMIAIADTCFLIDWIRYRRREILFQIFDVVYVPEEVLREIASENTLKEIVYYLSQGKLILYTPTRDVIEEAYRLMNFVNSLKWVRTIELPEAICLAIGYLYGYVVITENRGAIQVPEIIPGYSRVKVWKSFEILKEAILKRLIPVSNVEDIEHIFHEYEEDTKHYFPRKELKQVIEELTRYVIRSY